MDRVLTGELDCSRSAGLLPYKDGAKHTCILEFVGDCVTAVGGSLVGEELGQPPLFVITDNGQGQLDELSPGLKRGTVGRRDVKEILLTVHKGEMKLPELLWAKAGNLEEGQRS